MIKTDYCTDYGIVNTVTIIFYYAMVKRHNNCRKLAYFLLARAKGRGYKGDIKAAYQKDVLLEDMVRAVRELSRYICANDLCEMSRVLDKASPAGPVPETAFHDRGAAIRHPGERGSRRW